MEEEHIEYDETQNKRAWDRLYGNSEELVWGTEPIPFVREFVDRLVGEFSDSAVILDAARRCWFQ